MPGATATIAAPGEGVNRHERRTGQQRQRAGGDLQFFIPGLGQLVQGRLLMAIVMFVLAGVLWIFLLGWIIHLWSILDAALFKPAR
jgi:hypothetical protein